MIKLASMTWQYHELSLERALEGISRAGFRYVALGLPHQGVDVPNEHDESSVETIQALLQKYELEPVMLIANQQFKPGQPLSRAIGRLEAAKALGIKEMLSVGTSSYRKFPDEMFTEEEMAPVNQEFAEHFKIIADEAAARDLLVSLKPHTGNTRLQKRS